MHDDGSAGIRDGGTLSGSNGMTDKASKYEHLEERAAEELRLFVYITI